MKIIIILLVILVGFLASILLLYKKDLRKIKEELKDINDKGLDGTRIRSNSRDRDIGDLLVEINRNLGEKQKKSVDYLKKEEEIKETIASISHDLRTPLTSIKGYIDLLIRGEEDGKKLEYLNIVKSRAGALEYLVDSFYELSRLELREYEYNLEYIDIKKLLTEVILTFYDEFKTEDLELILDIDEGEYKAIADRKVMERVFNNLIDNGIKYSKSYLRLVLRKDRGIRINFINDTDNLDKESVEKIFNRFFIMDTSRQSESTGLGLYITKKMLEDMGHGIDGTWDEDKLNIEILLEE